MSDNGVITFLKGMTDIKEAAAFWQSKTSGKEVKKEDVGTLEAAGTVFGTSAVLAGVALDHALTGGIVTKVVTVGGLLIIAACGRSEVSAPEDEVPPSITIEGPDWAYVGDEVILKAYADKENLEYTWRFMDKNTQITLTGSEIKYTWQNPANPCQIQIEVYDPDSLTTYNLTRNIAIIDPSQKYVYGGYDRSPEEFVEYSDTEITYVVQNIRDTITSQPPADDSEISVSLNEEHGKIYEKSYDPTTGDYTFTVKFYDLTGSGYMLLQIGEGDAVTSIELWYPSEKDVYIVQDQATAEEEVTIELNEIPSGSSNFKWYVDGEWVSGEESLTYVFHDTSQQEHEVAVKFMPWYWAIDEDTVTISKDIMVYPKQPEE